MRSTHRLPLGLTVAAATLALAACSSAQGGEPAADAPVIRLADSYPLTHPFAEHGVSVFIDGLEAEGFEVEYFPAGQMGSPQDLAILARSGVIDVAPASAAYLEDQLPLSSVSDLPDMTTDACVAGRSMMDLLGEGGLLYEEEYEPFGVRPLWISIIPNYEILTADRPVVDPDDAQGLILRSSGGAFDVTMDRAGVAAVSIPAGDTYEAMSRGTVDGTAMPFLSVVPYRLDEVSQYSTDGLNMGSVGIPYVISGPRPCPAGLGEQPGRHRPPGLTGARRVRGRPRPSRGGPMSHDENTLTDQPRGVLARVVVTASRRITYVLLVTLAVVMVAEAVSR